MAWTAPMTAVAGSVWTAAQFNTHVRDNLMETCPAKASTSGSYFVTTAPNQITERQVVQAVNNSTDTTSSTSFVDLDNTPGPSLTVTTGSTALVVIGARIGGNTVGATNATKMTWQVDGATTIAPANEWSAGHTNISTSAVVYVSRAYLATGLTPGSNVFTCKYSVSGGTGTFQYRSILVMPF
jgi:hypothetical protein